MTRRPICPVCGEDMDDERHALCAPILLRRLVQVRQELARADRALTGRPDY